MLMQKYKTFLYSLEGLLKIYWDYQMILFM